MFFELIDFHVHFFPKAVFKAIWNYFESKTNGLWNIQYKIFGNEIIEFLKKSGVRKFTTLVYAHKPGIAEFLNRFVNDCWKQNPEIIIPFGTIYLNDGESEKTAEQLFCDWKFTGLKLHPFVTGDSVTDKRMFPIYKIMEENNKILLCHAGSGPAFTKTDGSIEIRKIAEKFPKLKIVIPHLGAFEYVEYRELAKTFPNIYLDTAMNCTNTKVFPNNSPNLDFFYELQDKILFGSDFPNIPYEFSEQITGLRKKILDDHILEKIFYKNAQKLLGSC